MTYTLVKFGGCWSEGCEENQIQTLRGCKGLIPFKMKILQNRFVASIFGPKETHIPTFQISFKAGSLRFTDE